MEEVSIFGVCSCEATYGLTISASIWLPRSVSHTPPVPGGKAVVQNGVSAYMHAVFDLIAYEELENWASLSHSFTEQGLLQLPG